MARLTIEELQRVDHDVLIRVETKVDTLTDTVKMMGDGYNERINILDQRIKKIEDIAIETDAPNSYKEMLMMKQDIHDFKTTALAYRAAGGLLGGLIFFILTQLPNILRLFGIIK